MAYRTAIRQIEASEVTTEGRYLASHAMTKTYLLRVASQVELHELEAGLKASSRPKLH